MATHIVSQIIILEDCLSLVLTNSYLVLTMDYLVVTIDYLVVTIDWE